MENLPEQIYRESKQRYYNHHTLRRVAVMQANYQRRRTLMMIAYDQHRDHAEIITIHPITRQQIEERLKSGRWTHEPADVEL
jgi:hypothetical protein